MNNDDSLSDVNVLAELRSKQRVRVAVPVRPDILDIPENEVIATLQAQIKELQETEKTLYVDPRSLKKSPFQYRKSFDPIEQAKLTESIKEWGVLENLIVRVVDGEYELIAGERRQISAIEADRLVPIKVMELFDRDARRIAAAENLNRVNLNPVEETCAVLNLIAADLEMESIDEVKSVLYELDNIDRGHIKIGSTPNVSGRIDLQRGVVNRILTENFGAMKLGSFIKTRLPLLNLSEELLDAIFKGIEPSKVQAIGKIEDPEQRADLLRLVLDGGMSLGDVRKQVSALKHSAQTDTPPAQKDRVRAITKKIVSLKIWETDPDKWARLEGMFEEMEQMITG
jgi:ParB family transcriptional regulator, chromosome partitioning protein